MIRELTAAALATLAVTARAEPEVVQAVPTEVTPAEAAAAGLPPEAAAPPRADEPEVALDEYRTPIEVLTERMIGSASRSVRFDWRKTTIGFGVLGSDVIELNNFGSAGFGGFARIPISGMKGELAVTRVWTWGSRSTEKLALTPYRQNGRPSRFEISANLAFPLAEGVVTAWPGFFPAAELCFSATAGFRYAYYPGAFAGAGVSDVARAILAPGLSDDEHRNLEYGERLPGMEIDNARYGFLVGFTTDIYFQSGIFFFPRVLFAVPLLSGAVQSRLGTWWELSFGLGWAI